MSGRKRNIAILFAAALLVLISCEDKGRRDIIVAKAGAASLGADRLMALVPEGFQNRFDDDALKFVSQWAEEEVLAEAACDLGLDTRPNVAAQIEEARRMILASEIERYLIVPRIVIDSADVGSFYHNHSDEFVRTDDEVLLSHIMVIDTTARDSVRVFMDSVSFADLAERFSEDPSGALQDEMGYLSRDRIHPKLAKRVFTLSEGEVAGPIETEFGYHFIKLIDFSPKGSMRELSEVERSIRDFLYERKFREAYREVLDSIEAVKGVTIDTNAIEEAMADFEN